MNKYLKSILVILYYFIYNIVIYIPFIILDIDINNIPDILYYLYSISMEILFIASLFLIYHHDFKHDFDDFKKNMKKYLKIGLHYWFLGLSIMIISNVLIGSFSPIQMPENEQAVRAALKISPLFIFISAVINAPLVEEIIFRKTIRDLVKNDKLYVVISGLVFGSFHVIGIATSIYSWLYVIPYAALGMAFAYTYVKTDNIFTSICLHSFHNFITVIQILLLV